MAASSENRAAEEQPEKQNIDSGKTSVHPGVVFLALTTVVSASFGFVGAISLAKKQDPVYFNKGVADYTRGKQESGVALGLRALRWGTLLAFSGVGLISFTVWKLLGVHNEFRAAVQVKMPVIPKKDIKDQGRNEFKSLRDLVSYLEEEDEFKRKKTKNNSPDTKS